MVGQVWRCAARRLGRVAARASCECCTAASLAGWRPDQQRSRITQKPINLRQDLLTAAINQWIGRLFDGEHVVMTVRALAGSQSRDTLR
jgi:hypothetical protein